MNLKISGSSSWHFVILSVDSCEILDVVLIGIFGGRYLELSHEGVLEKCPSHAQYGTMTVELLRLIIRDLVDPNV
jgi:hypothetical protein